MDILEYILCATLLGVRARLLGTPTQSCLLRVSIRRTGYKNPQEQRPDNIKTVKGMTADCGSRRPNNATIC